jgi:hypothetical protein
MASDYTQFIDQGASFTTGITISNVDLTSATVVATMRRDYTALTTIPITVTVTAPTTGQITLSMLPAATAVLWPGRYVYDVTYTIGTSTVRFIQGIVVVSPSTTPQVIV